jgi:hypothetical protein
MGYEKTILCLANSRKPPSGRCVAGKEMLKDGFGDWIRPISNRSSREISEEERRFASGEQARVLDIVRIPFLEPRPIFHQTENHLIDYDHHWAKKGVATWDELKKAVDRVRGPLWINGHSTLHGHNDKVAAAIFTEERCRQLNE